MHVNLQYAKKGMASSSSPLATLAALQVLQDGGNAFDAGICASAVLNVVLPMSCGLGGDIAVLGYVENKKKTYSISSLGSAPANASIAEFLARNLSAIPKTGIMSATIPATIEAYLKIHAEFCTLPLERLFKSAIFYAENGVTVGDQLHRWIKNNRDIIKDDRFLAETFLPFGNAAMPGSSIQQQSLANTYQRISMLGQNLHKDDWILESYMRINKVQNGLFVESDFYKPQCTIEEPFNTYIANHLVLTTGLPTQGYLLLQNLKLYEMAHNKKNIGDFPNKIHVLSEIFNQTYWQRLCKVGDPRFIDGLDDLLVKNNLVDLYGNINFENTTPCRHAGYYTEGDTSYFNIVDKQGNAVSWIQSLSLGFGSGVSVPETGVVLNSRLGRSCTLNPSQPNCCEPGKRPINTIFPYIVIKDEELFLMGGTPGGDGQAQWNTSFLSAMLLEQKNIVQALSEPKWTYFPGADLIESDISQSIHIEKESVLSIQNALQEKGHLVIEKKKIAGALRVIQNKKSHFIGADDGREDGLTLGY